MLNIENVFPIIKGNPANIFITTHHKPDGDAMGSTLGLYHYLLQYGHNVTVVSPSEVPDFLAWMPGMEHVLNFEAEPKACLKVLSEAQLIFCLDFNRLERIKTMEEPLRTATAPKALIDHHLEPDVSVFAFGISQPNKSSTCEMVYDFIQLAEDGAKINLPIAQCLYTGVMTDTGSFRFPITTASVHSMIADLKTKGLEHAIIHQHIYDSWSAERIRFLGYVLYQKMEIYAKQNIGIIALSLADQEQFKIASGDTEGMVNYPLSIEDINMSIMLTEKKDEVRMSFRSKGAIDVATFATAHFQGGGHFNAAGGKSTLNLQETLNKLKQLLHIS